MSPSTLETRARYPNWDVWSREVGHRSHLVLDHSPRTLTAVETFLQRVNSPIEMTV